MTEGEWDDPVMDDLPLDEEDGLIDIEVEVEDALIPYQREMIAVLSNEVLRLQQVNDDLKTWLYILGAVSFSIAVCTVVLATTT